MDPSEQMLRSGTYSDLAVVCAGRTWKVHKAIVCPYSTYFQTMCQSAFSEAEKDKLAVEEQLPDIVDRALEYLYTKDYSDEPDRIEEVPDAGDPTEAVGAVTDALTTLEVSEDQEPVPLLEGSLKIEDSTTLAPSNANQPDELVVTPMSSVMINVLVYTLADLWGIEGLKRLACDKLKPLLVNGLFIHDLAAAAQTALQETSQTDEDLRILVCRFIVDSGRGDLMDAFEQAEPTACTLLAEMRFRYDEAEKARSDAIATAERLLNEIEGLEHNIEVDNEELHKWQKSAEEVVRLVNHTKGCLNQNCDVDFGARIGSYGHGDLFRLRCRGCQMKHT